MDRKKAEGLSQSMVALSKADIRVAASLKRKDLLPGSDVVVTTIGVGSRRAWETHVYISPGFTTCAGEARISGHWCAPS